MQLIEPILADSAAAIASCGATSTPTRNSASRRTRTADVIAQRADRMGHPHPPRPGHHRRRRHRQGHDGSDSRAVGLRADIDALPITEHNTFPHASKHPGKMHACGHDGHTAMLLAAAKHLAKHRNFDGTVYLVFQPAEEGGGGAREMIKDGLFERFPMEAIFGVHNWPGLKVGQFALKRRPVLRLEQRVPASPSTARARTRPCRTWASTRCRSRARWCRPSRPSSRATSGRSTPA